MEITVQEFKAQFPRFTPVYLPVYVAGKTYFMGDVVYYENLFYKCKVENTTELPTDNTKWDLINQSVLNYCQDSDIVNAMAEANINFNEGLFGDIAEKKLVFGYLVAYYLTVDFKNALGQSSAGIVTSKSVGSVSESVSLPQWMLNDKLLGAYARNGYGMKYLSLLQPHLIGNIMFFEGATTI